MDGTANPARERLLAALKVSDEQRRVGRAERIEWLALHAVNPPAVMGRTETMRLLGEARECFVGGHFIATLLVAMSFIEHTVVEELQALAYIKGSPTLGQALEVAESHKVFPADWLARAKVLSLRRNPFVHLKEAEHRHGLGMRIRDEKRHPTTILESDAKDAIDLLYNFFVATLRPDA